MDDSTNFTSLSQTFNSTSNYAKLQSVHTAVAGRLVYVRFKANTGDAMGMNMLSKVYIIYLCVYCIVMSYCMYIGSGEVTGVS